MKIINKITLGLLVGISFISTSTKSYAFCFVPSLYNCYCTYVFPCPVMDLMKIAQENKKTIQTAQKLYTAYQELQGYIELLRSMTSVQQFEFAANSFADQDPLPFDGNGPAEEAGKSGSFISNDFTPQQNAGIATEVLTSPGTADSKQDAAARKAAVNALAQKQTQITYARAIEALTNQQRYQKEEKKMLDMIGKSSNVQDDWKTNSYIKIQISNILKDRAELMGQNNEISAIHTLKSSNPGITNAYYMYSKTGVPDTTGGTGISSSGDNYPTRAKDKLSAPYDLYIVKSSISYGTPEGMLRWQIYKESSFNPDAQSKISSAHGLAQIVKGTAANPGYGIPPVNSSDPQSSINFAGQYDAILYKRLKMWTKVLHAYGTT